MSYARITLDELQDEIGDWGDRTFPRSTPESVLSHFGEEAAELLEGANAGDDPENVAEEAADVFLLLLHLAHKRGFRLSDAVGRKMAVNRARTWKTEPEPGGHFKHEVTP